MSQHAVIGCGDEPFPDQLFRARPGPRWL